MNSLTLLNEHAVDIALADRIDYYNPKVCRSTFDIDQQCRLIAVLINGLIQLWRVDNVNSPVLLITVPADELSSCLSMDPNATNEPVNGIAGMHYLPDSEQLIMVLLSGDLLQIWPAESKFEIVGTVEGGVQEAQFSADDQLLAMITGLGNLLLMSTLDFNVISETVIEHDTQTAEQPISVGWGRKETQFHGSAGKQAALAPNRTSFSLSPDDDRQPSISWRADCQYFVCSTIESASAADDNERRVLRVYNRQGQLQSTSEPVDRLEHSLCCRPSGNLIASTQRLAGSGKHQVVMFERNGLRHGEFQLRKPADWRVVRLLWNCDSSVLAVWLRPPSGFQAATDVVELWTSSNYHWYRQQSLYFQCLLDFQWDPEKPRLIYSTTSVSSCGDDASGSIKCQQFQFAVDIYRSAADRCDVSDAGWVAQVDGDSVLLTSVRNCQLPPPMSQFNIPVSSFTKEALYSQVRHVCFSTTMNDSASSNQMAVLTDRHVLLFNCGTGKPADGLEPQLLNCFQLPSLPRVEKTNFYRQLIWPRSDLIILLAGESLVVIKITDSDSSAAENIQIVRLNEPMIRLYANPTFGDLLLQSADGQIWEILINYDGDGDGDEGYDLVVVVESLLDLALPAVCPQFSSARVQTADGNGDSNQRVIISRSEMNLLYANQKTICSNCTSFICHPQFLIYTTMEHRVCFLPWSYDFLSNGPLPINDSCALSSRRIERGATIVTHTPGDVGLVFQLPRGNLETVQPRALTISHVRHLLDQAEYGEAFRVCRRNRIDMNLLFDYNPQQFLRSCAAIVQQLHSVDNLNLLISGMRDENVTQTMYSWFPSTSTKSNMAQLTPPPPTSPSTIAAAAATPAVTAKVNSICTALRQAIDQNERASKLFHSALMTFVRMEPPDLEGALRRIQQRQQGSENDGSGEQALRYIVIFVNVDHLFRVALGMYDLPLSVSVAQHSTNKDPREYLPLLSGWRRLGEQGAPNYQRYQIDRYLGRNELALTNLLQAIQHKESLPAVDLEREFMQFCRQHSLHRHAISICPTGFPLQKVVLQEFAEQLEADGNLEDAAVAFQACANYRQSMECHLRTANWRQLFAIMHRLGIAEGTEQFVAMAKQAAQTLRANGRHQEAATVLFEYARAPMDAIRSLLDGRSWLEAERHIHRYQLSDGESRSSSDLITSLLVPALAGACGALTNDLEELIAQFERHRQRLIIVRQQNASQLQLPVVAEVEVFPDSQSMATYATTMASTAISSKLSAITACTRKTSKAKRKFERRKLAGKEGSLFEEDYLVDSLCKLIIQWRSIRDDLPELIQAMLSHSLFRQAAELQQLAGKVESNIRENVKEIFRPAPPQLHQLPTALRLQLTSIINEGLEPGALNPFPILFKTPVEPELLSKQWQSSLI